MFYDIRSCDLLRHFQDDIYLACRLLIWMWNKLINLDEGFWGGITPGDLIMHIYSLHIFQQDLPVLKYRLEKKLL